MKKVDARVGKQKIQGEAYELISIMAILCVQAIEHRFTRFYRHPGTVVDVFKGKEFLAFTKRCYAHDEDLKNLADHFEVFLRVVERVAARR